MKTDMDSSVLQDLIHCSNTELKHFQKGDTVSFKNEKVSMIGLILTGEVVLRKVDVNGDLIQLEKFGKDDLLSSMWVNEPELSNLLVTSATDILFLDTDFFLTSCNPICPKYPKILAYLFSKLMNYTEYLNHKTRILQQKNMQEKLMAYFRWLAEDKGTNRFEIPMSFKELADYIGVDRSALMRKLNELEEKKKIVKKGKTIYLKDAF